MALAFREVEFHVGPHDCGTPWESSEKFDFPRRIKLDEDNDRPVVDVAIKAYDLEGLNNGKPDDFEVWHDQVKAEVASSGHRSGEVKVAAWLRPNPGWNANSGFGFQGYVKVLVIADLEDPARP